jgi:hypothetical protein
LSKEVGTEPRNDPAQHVLSNICEIIFRASDLGELSLPRAFLTLLLARENRDMRRAAIKVESIALRRIQILCTIGNLSLNASIQSHALKL